MTVVAGIPYTVELRVYHPERNAVEFISMTGINHGHCVNKLANKYPGWVVSDLETEILIGDPGEHFWNHDGTVCVKCGVFEHLAFEDCSGFFGLL